MTIVNFKMTRAWFALGVLVLSASLCTEIRAQAPAVDPAATQILRRMTNYFGSLQQFSAHTQTTIEEMLEAGHRVDFSVGTSVVVSRPNKIHAKRVGDLVEQAFYYDGKTLTLYNASAKVYATEPAPETIEGLLDFARESLGLIFPISDLMYHNAFALLMQDVTFATVVGKAVISGVKCDHLVFSRPGVDFQVWVADGAQPLPCKYVVTDTGTPERLSITTVVSNVNLAPNVDPSRFSFTPPQGAKPISFLRNDTASGASR